METRMKGSKAGIESWLVAAAAGCKPNGERLKEVVRLNDGEEVVIVYSGGQSFGSGGFSAGASYAGEEPELVGEEGGHSTQFISESGTRFRMKAPSVIYEWSYDCIGSMSDPVRWFRKHAYMCATDAQIEEARQKLFSGPITESEIEAIKDWLRKEDNSYVIGEIRNHLRNGPESPRGWNGTWQDCFAMTGVSSRGLTKLMINEPNPEKRTQPFADVAEEKAAAKKAEGKAFAKARLEELEKMGISRRRAVEIMKAAGPGRCIEAVRWANQAMDALTEKLFQEHFQFQKEASERYGYGYTDEKATEIAREQAEGYARDLLDVILCGSGGTNHFGKGRMEGVLKSVGVEPPSSSNARGLWAILAGAHVAIM